MSLTDTAEVMARIVETLDPEPPSCQRCAALEADVAALEADVAALVAELAPWRAVDALRHAQAARWDR